MLTEKIDCMQNKRGNEHDDLKKFRDHNESIDQACQNDVLHKFRNYKI
jgi:hypothetical protein